MDWYNGFSPKQRNRRMTKKARAMAPAHITEPPCSMCGDPNPKKKPTSRSLIEKKGNPLEEVAPRLFETKMMAEEEGFTGVKSNSNNHTRFLGIISLQVLHPGSGR